MSNNNIKNIVITGASVSYNHYDYDDIFRINAHECFAGMQSWSFRLRDFLIKKNSFFVDAKDIIVTGADKVLPETLNINLQNFINLENCIVIKVQKTKKEVTLRLKSPQDRVVLHLQNVLNYSCQFDAIFNEHSVSVNNKGNASYFQGMSPKQIELNSHLGASSSVVLKNFKFIDDFAYIVLTGYSLISKKVYLSGKGATITQFMVDNYDERIGQYNPDLVIFTTGGNDRYKTTSNEYKNSLATLFSMIKKSNKNCKIVAIYLVEDSVKFNEKGELMDSKAFLDALKIVAQENDATVFDMNDVFRDIPIKEWKFDNIHLNKNGNNIMFDTFSDFLVNNKFIKKYL